jgi:hypothetical protein
VTDDGELPRAQVVRAGNAIPRAGELRAPPRRIPFGLLVYIYAGDRWAGAAWFATTPRAASTSWPRIRRSRGSTA